MKSSMLHERRRMGELIGLNGTLIGCAGLEPYGVFDTPPTCGPGILDPSECMLGRSYAYYSAGNGFAFNPADFAAVAGFAYSPSQDAIVPPPIGQACYIQSPVFSSIVGSEIYVRYIYAPKYSSAGSFITCCANWGRERVSIRLLSGQAFTNDAVTVQSNVSGSVFLGAPNIDVNIEYDFTHRMIVGSLVAGTTYNFTAINTCVRTSDNFEMFNSTDLGTFDAGASPSWEFYYNSANNDNLRITDLYMIGTGFRNNCSGT